MLEAIMSIWLLVIISFGLIYVHATQSNFEKRVESVLSQNIMDWMRENIVFIKERTMSLGNEQKRTYILQNIKYPWWTKLKVTE